MNEQNDLTRVRKFLAADGRIQVFEREWKDGPVTYVHVAPLSPVRANAAEKLTWLNGLVGSIELVCKDLGFKPGSLAFRVEAGLVHFGQIVVSDTVVICLHPSAWIAEQIVSARNGQMTPLRVSSTDFAAC